jgi:hypothetical protein
MKDMYIFDYAKDEVIDLQQLTIYRAHLWSKNIRFGRIILKKVGEYSHIGNDTKIQQDRDRPISSPYGMKMDKFDNLFAIDGLY